METYARLSKNNAIMAGVLTGDGYNANHYERCLTIGDKDMDYFKHPIKRFIGKQAKNNRHKISYQGHNLNLTYRKYRIIPETIMNASKSVKRAFLKGLFSANGHVTKSNNYVTVTLTQTSIAIALQVSRLLNELGLDHKIYKKEPHKVMKAKRIVHFSQSHLIKIQRKSAVECFSKTIGFIQKYKNDAAKPILGDKDRKTKQEEKKVEGSLCGCQELTMQRKK